MRVVAPATNASVLPASYHVGPIASARETGTIGWSLHATQSNPAASAFCAARRISGPPTSRSQGRTRDGICWIAGRLRPNRGRDIGPQLPAGWRASQTDRQLCVEKAGPAEGAAGPAGAGIRYAEAEGGGSVAGGPGNGLGDRVARRSQVPVAGQLRHVDAEPGHEDRIRLDGLHVRCLVERRDARHGLLDVGRELLGLAARPSVVPVLELRHDPIGEQLERGADVLVPVVAALLDEDHLVDADVLEGLHGGADLVGVADP